MDLLSDPAVIWFLIGLALLILELALPGLVVLFFGIGAWVTALACRIFDIDLNFQILIFLVTSLLGLVLLRKYLKNRFFSRRSGEAEEALEEFIGHKAKVLTDFKDGEGKVEIKGTPWNAVCDEPLKKGQTVVIEKKDSLTLFVKPNKK